MAGLWDTWRGEDLVAIITAAANAAMLPVHERMPLIIAPEQAEAWVHGDAAERLLQRAADVALEVVPVSADVNSPAHDYPALVQPIHSSEE